jgi:hypothetical protein
VTSGDEPEPARVRDWRETLSAAADFALLGIVVSIASLGVLTLGAALATGSAATAHWCRYRAMPPVPEMARLFVRGLGAGIVVSVVAVVGAALLVADLVLVGRGLVPGGRGFLVVSIVVATQVVGLGALVLVQVGARGGTGWRAAARWAGGAAFAAPLAPTALAAVLAVAVTIAVMVPVTTPVLLGFALFALHVVAGRVVRRRGSTGPA